MKIEQAVIGLLLATPVIFNAVGTDGAFAEELPQAAKYPCIRIIRISGGSELTLSSDKWRRVRLQIEAWDTSIPGSQTLGEDIEDLLDGYAGAPLRTDGTDPGVTIKSCMLDNSLDLFDSTSRAWRRIADYKIQYV